MHYRITKYDPRKRNEFEHYTNPSEWTSISDIGKDLTYDQYEKIESAYVSAINIILKEKEVVNLEIDSLELHGVSRKLLDKEPYRLKGLLIDYDDYIKSLKNGLRLTMPQMETIIRLILREVIWMILMSSNIRLEFGYDYYMYVTCSELGKDAVNSIEDLGLFVEPGIARPSIELNEI